MSLMLTFRSATSHTIGPLPALRADGETLRTVEGQVIAKHEQNLWQVQGAHYPRLDCKGPLLIWFEREAPPKSRTFGPFEGLAVFDGVAYIGTRVFASLNQEKGNWYCHEIGGYWRVMAVWAVESP